MGQPVPTAEAFHPLRMGLEPLALEDWLCPHRDDALLAERASLVATHPDDVLAALPESGDAVAELTGFLRGRGFTAITPGRGIAALASLARAVAEDICLLTHSADDRPYRLTAGALCFPNRWRLKEKLGGDVLAVHGPVPDYAEGLSVAVDRFLARLRPLRGFIRDNWGLVAVPDLYLPDPVPPVNPARHATFYVRREAQSFLKLPSSGAVVFAIRTTVTPWAQMPEGLRQGILTTVKALSPQWLAYKSIDPGNA